MSVCYKNRGPSNGPQKQNGYFIENGYDFDKTSVISGGNLPK
jgi:hypothetical protein